MSLNDTVKEMRELLAAISVDLEKAANGNKAASQRVRTGTIRLEKAAKKYRKESIKAEKTQSGKKAAKKPAAKKPAVKVKAAARPKAKAMHAHASKRPTAKIPVKR